MERGRCLSPASATDIRHEHPCHRPTTEPVLSHEVNATATVPTSPRKEWPALRQTALRRSGPGSPTLDGVVRASVFPVHTEPFPRWPPLGGHRVGAPAGARNDAPFSDAASLHERPLTPPVTHALRTTVGAAIRFAYAESHLRCRLVKGDCLRRPETPSIGRYSLDSAFRPSPSQILDGSLSPCSSLGHEVPASGARSPTFALAKDG